MSEGTNELFTSGTSLEYRSVGRFDPTLGDDGGRDGPYHWFSSNTNDPGTVAAYAAGEAYDYAEHGLTRNPRLAEYESTNAKYLSVLPDERVERSVFSRSEVTNGFSNVVVRVGARASIYCDALVRFDVACDENPLGDEPQARLAVWARLDEVSEGVFATNMIVTAGYLGSDLKSVTSRDYRLVCDLGDSAWHRLTIRAHGDVTSKGAGVSGFSIYLDGQPVRCLADDYEIADPAGRLSARLTAEARALLAERRLFTGLTPPGDNRSSTVSGFSFLGGGSVDDVTFSSDDPGYGKVDTVFTLAWDAGVSLLKYTLDGGLTTNAAPVGSALQLDILLGAAATNGLTLKVTDVAYDTAGGYAPGTWRGAGGATLTNGTEFVFGGGSYNPVAAVASSCACVDIGSDGTCNTFAEAFAALDASTNAVKVLRLTTDLTVMTAETCGKNGYRLLDNGYVAVTNVSGEYVLDLNGHTLKGNANARTATLVVRCKSFRVRDSSPTQTGRLLPPVSHTNESESASAVISVEAQTGADGQAVEPVVTLESGIYDGWVRNRSHVDGDTALSGVIFVEGGSYISTNGTSFYLEPCVTNALKQFIYRDEHWSTLGETNLVIWTGLGDGRHWADPGNWKMLEVPKPGDTAFFPSRAEPWTVDVGLNGMTTTNLWLEGNVALAGTNDFREVTVTGGGTGRILGDALLLFEGDQPGRLTESVLHPDWAGTVLLRDVGYPTTVAPKILRNMDTWGTADSTVVFEGVRGYVMETSPRSMPYAFVLNDHVCTNGSTVVTNLAWRNDSGYTGSTLAFLGALTGTGTFQSGRNSRTILQLFKFSDVSGFRGKFTVNGKRVLIGSEIEMVQKPGLIAFGSHAVVASRLGWTCQNAIFGTSLRVWGGTNDVLVTCTAAQPDVSGTDLVLNDVSGVAWLACTNSPKWSVYVSGERPVSAAGASARLAAAVPLAASALDAYNAASLRAAARVAAVAAVAAADISIEVGESGLAVLIRNVSEGLWYGVRQRASLTDDWSAPVGWTKASGDSVALSVDKADLSAGFYQVVVSYEDPYASAGGADE